MKQQMALDLKMPLQRGGAMVEASAGTGKTYSIAVLIVKAIIESGIPLEKILIVTFTRDASAELRDRIRSFLCAARDLFENENTITDNVDIVHVVNKAREDQLGFNMKKIRVERALSHIDEAPVYTIHAFCQKLLKEFSFETMTPPGLQLSEDDTPFVTAAASYTFRKYWYDEDQRIIDAICSYQKSYLYSVQTIEKMLRERLNTPLARLLPELPDIGQLRKTFEELDTKYAASARAAAALWVQHSEEILTELDNFAILDGHTYKVKHLELYHEAFRELAAKDAIVKDETVSMLMRFRSGQLIAKLKKAHAGFVPAHPFFAACDECAALYEDRSLSVSTLAVAVKKAMIGTAYERYETEKRLYQKLTYNDLLVRLLHALKAQGGADLAKKIAARFEAVFVDEFQDTDSLQYEIFARLFPHKGRIFYCIGDPKQSIYSFRGADIHSYLSVATQMPHRFTLKKNYRSSASLINAVNQLFSSEGSFLTQGIRYEPVDAADKAAQRAPAECGALSIRYLDFQRKGSKERGIDIVSTDLVRNIAELIGSTYSGGEDGSADRVKASDIAILTRTSREAGILWQKLSDAGIPATDISERSVFETVEMYEMYLLLAAIADVRLDTIAAVLSSRLFGKSHEYVHCLESGSRGDFWLERFISYRNIFRSAGFVALFERVASETAGAEDEIPAAKKVTRSGSKKMHQSEGTSLYSRILPDEGGARSVTNYRHIAELLHAAAIQNRLDEQQLMQWAAKRMNAREKEDEQPVRLDRDGDVVKIMTLHKSKGLEFPIVFLPFCWTHKNVFSDTFINATYPYNESGERILDVRGPRQIDEEAKSRIRDDLLAEEIRLLYVGMTRAKNSLVMYYCNYEQADNSSLAWLFAHQDIADYSYAAFVNYCKSREMADLINERIGTNKDIRFVTVDEGEKNVLRLTPAVAGELVLAQCERTGIERDWAVGSFTKIERLTRFGEKDYDSFAAVQTENSKVNTTLAPGARSGIILHSIFERLDFKADDSAMRNHIVSCLSNTAQSGISADEVFTLIKSTVSTRLRNGFSLDMIERSQTLRELEFYFPLANAGAFAQVLKGSKNYPNLAELSFENFHGFMKGFIDLVFVHEGRWFIVDWKSNYLGPDASDYAEERITREIQKHNYNLQYIIYTLALHRYLSKKLADYSYQKHFGGVYYLFVRNTGTDCGVHYDVPEFALIDKIDKAIMRGDAG